MARKPIKIITPLVRTVKPPYRDMPVDGFVPGWDAEPGTMQHAKRISIAEPGNRPYEGHDSNHPPRKSDHPKY